MSEMYKKKQALASDIIDRILDNLTFHPGTSPAGHRNPVYPQTKLTRWELIKMIDAVYEKENSHE